MSAIIPVVFLLFVGWVTRFQFAACYGDSAPACSINLNRDLPPQNQPILLKKVFNNYTLLIPQVKRRQGLIELNRGEELVLACPGKNNYLKEAKKESIKSTCVSDTTLSSNGSKEIFSTKNAGCAQPAQAVVKVTTERCAQIGKIYEIGFEAEGWHQMVTVCHDPVMSNTLFSKHTLMGAAIQGAERESNRPRFSDGQLDELYFGFNPDYYYKKKTQENLFRNIVGDIKKTEYYAENGDKFLSRGHLAPDGDFVFGSWQFATYFYINAAPQWQMVNGQNWLTVEKLARKMSIKLADDLIIVTGTYGVLELEDERGIPRKLYLNFHKRTIPVPQFYWKVISHPKTRQAVAIVTANNPYLKSTAKISFCKDICFDKGWANANITQNFHNVSQGLTVCCTFSELRAAIPHVPFLDVQETLRGPHF